MGAWHEVSAAGLYGLCFALSIVSALVPWVNGEVLLLSFSALARSPFDLGCLVLLASAGQMAGKCALYWAGRGALRLRFDCAGRVVASWRERFISSPSKHLSLVFVSSALGIPPFYVITVLAGAFRIGFGQFVGVGMCGRLVRFGTLVFIPRLALQWLH
jgi:membrane protein YqaA with SNARE-associated domain